MAFLDRAIERDSSTKANPSRGGDAKPQDSSRELAGPPKVVARDVPHPAAGEGLARTAQRPPPQCAHCHRPRRCLSRRAAVARYGRAGHSNRRLQPQRLAQPGRPEPDLGHAVRPRSRCPRRAAVHRLQHGRGLHGSLWAARPRRVAVEGAEQGLRLSAAADRPAEWLDGRHGPDRLWTRQRRSPARAAGADEGGWHARRGHGARRGHLLPRRALQGDEGGVRDRRPRRHGLRPLRRGRAPGWEAVLGHLPERRPEPAHELHLLQLPGRQGLRVRPERPQQPGPEHAGRDPRAGPPRGRRLDLGRWCGVEVRPRGRRRWDVYRGRLRRLDHDGRRHTGALVCLAGDR